MSDEIRPMTYAAVEATIAREEARRAENAGKGYRCGNCADTGIVPAPEPYGSWGCTWACGCVVDRLHAAFAADTGKDWWEAFAEYSAWLARRRAKDGSDARS